jgi:cell division protein FtsB
MHGIDRIVGETHENQKAEIRTLKAENGQLKARITELEKAGPAWLNLLVGAIAGAFLLFLWIAFVNRR